MGVPGTGQILEGKGAPLCFLKRGGEEGRGEQGRKKPKPGSMSGLTGWPPFQN